MQAPALATTMIALREYRRFHRVQFETTGFGISGQCAQVVVFGGPFHGPSDGGSDGPAPPDPWLVLPTALELTPLQAGQLWRIRLSDDTRMLLDLGPIALGRGQPLMAGEALNAISRLRDVLESPGVTIPWEFQWVDVRALRLTLWLNQDVESIAAHLRLD